jgi:hypothetical protein
MPTWLRVPFLFSAESKLISPILKHIAELLNQPESTLVSKRPVYNGKLSVVTHPHESQ